MKAFSHQLGTVDVVIAWVTPKGDLQLGAQRLLER